MITTKKIYTAFDGKVFDTSEECIKYEDQRYKDLRYEELDRYADDHTYASWWGDLSGLGGYVGSGSCDDRVYLIKVDPKVIEWAKSLDLDLTEHENKPVFLLWTCDSLYFEGTLDEVIHSIGADLDWMYKARKELQ